MVNFKNLIKIRDWLRDNDVPFDMAAWRSDGSLPTAYDKPHCGTHGCAIGWCPEISGLEYTPEDWCIDGGFDWPRYAFRITNVCGWSDLWAFLFSPGWVRTKYGGRGDAVDRLTWVIDNRMEELFIADTPKGLERAMEYYLELS